MRGLDHIVHLVKDLDKAGAAYEKAGFLVGARNQHPWGTHNRIVQFNGFFIEILEVVQPSSANYFAEFNSNLAIEKFQGGSMVVLEGTGGEAQEFTEKGLGGITPFRFEREGEMGKVGFELAFARFNFKDNRPYATPHLGFFTCKQLAPQNFWKAEKQRHVNGAKAVEELVFVSENPSDYAEFFSHFTGQRDMTSTSLGVTIATPRGLIRIVDSSVFEMMFGFKPSDNPPLTLAAVVLKGAKAKHVKINNLHIFVRAS